LSLLPSATFAQDTQQTFHVATTSGEPSGLDIEQGKEVRLVDELRALQAAVMSRDEGLLVQALEEFEEVRLVEDLLAAARCTLAPLQRARESLDAAVSSVTQSATEVNMEALRRAISQGAATGLAEDRLAAAREALREAHRAAPLAAQQRAHETLSSAVKSATLKATEVNLQLLRRAIDQGAAAGLGEEELAAGREALREVQTAAALAATQRASEALDRALKLAAQNASAANIQVLQRAIEQGVGAGLAEDRLAAARESLAEVQRTSALTALRRAREALDGAARSAGSSKSMDTHFKALQRAIDQGAAVGLPEDKLNAAREAIWEARRVPALAALQRAHEALDAAVSNDAPSVTIKVEVLRGAIDRGAIAGLSEDELAAAREAVREAPRASALVGLRHACEDVERAVSGAAEGLDAKTGALQRAIDRCTAVGVGEDQLSAAREAMRVAQQAAVLAVLQRACEVLDRAVRSDDQNVAANVEVLRSAVEMGAAAGLSEDRLTAAVEAMKEAPKAAALVGLQRAYDALDAAAASGDQDMMDTRIEALRRAVHRGAVAGLTEDQLAAAREAIREASRAVALVALQRARGALDDAVRSAEQNVDASIAVLQRAIDQGAAAGLTEDQLAAAKEAMREAPRAAASAALQHAYDGLHSAMIVNIDTLQRAIDRRVAIGDTPESQLATAKETLREAKIVAALTSLQRARETLHSAPRQAAGLPGSGVAFLGFDQQMNVATLQRAISEAEVAGVAEHQLSAARADVEWVALEQVRAALDTAVASAAHCPSDRNISMLQRAIDQAAALGAEEQLAAARETLREAQTTATMQPVDECSICFEQEVTSLMPCCGREGSGMRICSTCLARHTDQARAARCPFCRSPI